MTISDYRPYFLFLRYVISPGTTFPYEVKEIKWRELYKFSIDQAIAGFVFEGIKRLGEQGVKPDFDVLMEWIALENQIKGQNKQLYKKCVDVISELRQAGFDCCVLKGQGNGRMYSNPYSRTPGDIDVIIRHTDRKRILNYVHEKKLMSGCHIHHVEYMDDGISVELHSVPCFMNNPVYNRRLQSWLASQAEKDNIWKNDIILPDGMGIISMPSIGYNIIYQLSHVMHHFFDEGIGLRQMMDYYFVLKTRNTDLENQGNTELGRTLRYLGLWKFAGAVMYVMQVVFALDEIYMIAPVDEKRGRTLLNEILKGGNFGKYSGLTNHSKGGKYLAKTWRNLKLVREYPAEALCEPFFRTWHFFWRLRYN